MGFDTRATEFLLAAERLGVSFDRTATIGRQRLYVTPGWLGRRLRRAGFDVDRAETARLLTEADGFAEPFLRLLGANEVVSLDASDYEGASRVVNLNEPLPPETEGAFTAVVDAGSLEHVFDFPAAVGNCMRMVAVNGHFLGVTVTNNMAGHGFYQFSPELFYRVFAPQNGYRVERMLLAETSSARWYEVRDPAETGSRAELRTFRPACLCVIARRVADGPVLATAPQQSDYVSRWNDHNGGRPPARAAGNDLHPVERCAPHAVARTIRSLYHFAQAAILPFDRRSFRRVDISNPEPDGKADL